MIILVADDNALSRELIRELLEGSGQAAEKFWIQQIFWYPTTLTDVHAQRPPAFWKNHRPQRGRKVQSFLDRPG
jgi:CheY-like chemotaxis protein